MGTMGEKEVTFCNDDHGYFQELQDVKKQNHQWEQMFNLACHDRDTWQQQCETLETIVQKQRAQIKLLKETMRQYVDLAYKFRDEVLEAVGVRTGSLSDLDPFQGSTQAEHETEGVGQAARDEGPDSGEALEPFPGSGGAEGICPTCQDSKGPE